MKKGFTPYDGIYVVIHNKTLFPDLDSHTIQVQPNTVTNIGIKSRSIERLPPPFISGCTKLYPEKFHLSGIKYSQEYCNSECKSRYFRDKCNCTHPYFMPPTVSQETSFLKFKTPRPSKASEWV